ncbi:Hsp20/alpha crystallin family protein [Mesobacillus maritimus]|uniref:Hsp20/alpha crystallin family protein n=1 Tax=Mesobacillus maritimus TaxID=1643336 RepID=UPI00204007A8|nr:Hsp20/alpha crystallin family protein [Mesobacillus maritimus]MCM3585466.1 Hsp20/alpha crystallin family protein [Mesobacillus maritimus]
MPVLHDLLPKIWNRKSYDLEDFFENSWSWNKVFDVDVKETEKLITIEADLPGFNKEDIHLEIDDYALTIKATRSTELEQRGEKYFKRERQFGSIERTIPLPTEVRTETSTAKYNDGVLKITFEKVNPTISHRKAISIE